MKDECLICRAPLAYLEKDELMECVICHKKENSKTKCVNGHYICKRDSFLSILSAVDFVEENFGISMEKPKVICRYSSENNQCIGKRCPFAKVNH